MLNNLQDGYYNKNLSSSLLYLSSKYFQYDLISKGIFIISYKQEKNFCIQQNQIQLQTKRQCLVLKQTQFLPIKRLNLVHCEHLLFWCPLDLFSYVK